MSFENRRISRLYLNGEIRMLAINHVLSTGVAFSTNNVQKIMELEAGKHVSSIVCTPGQLRQFKFPVNTQVLLQCVSVPNILNTNTKTKLCSIMDAIRLGVDGLSVQLDFSDPNLSDALQVCNELIHGGRSLSIPVLLMVNDPVDGYTGVDEYTKILHSALSLGADVIKIAFPWNEKEVSSLNLQISSGDRVIMAGGKSSDHVLSRYLLARDLGFCGFCFGRNVFESDDPSKFLKKICGEE